jgi:general secretion pathway protein B
MSYILDALKKSDQQRQRGATPTLLTAQTMTAEPKRPRLLPAGMLATLLIATGIVIGWLRPWQPVPPLAVSQPGAMKPAAPPASVAPGGPAPAVVPDRSGTPAPAPPPVQPSLSVAEGMARSASAVAKQPGAVPADPAERPALSPEVPFAPRESATPLEDKTTQPRPADAIQHKEAVAMHELPPSIQREIPAIAISFHIYSSLPRERRVMINGEMARQGDFLTPGLSIEQITPDGVILGYKGYRIRRGLR